MYGSEFINAVKEVKQEKTMGFLEQKHIDKIFDAYKKFDDQDKFAVLVDIKDVLEKNANMAINLYIRPDSLADKDEVSFTDSYNQWQQSSENLRISMDKLFKELS